MFLVCHMISQDQMTKGWRNIMGKSLSWQVTRLPSLVTIATVIIEINDFRLSRDLTRPRDRWVMLLYLQKPLKISYRPAKFGGYRHFDG